MLLVASNRISLEEGTIVWGSLPTKLNNFKDKYLACYECGPSERLFKKVKSATYKLLSQKASEKKLHASKNWKSTEHYFCKLKEDFHYIDSQRISTAKYI